VSADQARAIERIRSAVDDERLPRQIRDLLEGPLNAEGFQEEADAARADDLQAEIDALQSRADEADERAESLETVGGAVLDALDCVDEWENAEDREAKGHAREALIDALARLVEAFETSDPDGAGDEGEDVFDPEEQAALALADREAHAAVAALIDRHRDALQSQLSGSAWLVLIGLQTWHEFKSEVPGEGE
jgi:hypothetical protein